LSGGTGAPVGAAARGAEKFFEPRTNNRSRLTNLQLRASWDRLRYIMLRVFYRFFALCLALSWVPATAHCRMEAIGLNFASCADSCHDKASSEAAHDSCSVVENGLYKSGSSSVKVSPVMVQCVCIVCLRISLPPSGTEPTVQLVGPVDNRDWVPARHFVQRTVAPAHAPDSVVA
jgi:hypothetical protein